MTTSCFFLPPSTLLATQFSRRRVALSLALLALMVPFTASAQSKVVPESRAAAGNPADVFKRQKGDSWITRDVTFAELGFNGPVVLGAPDSRREIYLPVPAGVMLADAVLKMDADYMRADGGRTSLIISLDNYPVSARGFALDHGDASASIAIDGARRPSGFVRLGLNWTTAVAFDASCADARTPGNVLRIEPDTHFSYRFDGASIRDLTTAWSALPAVPVILVAGNKLTAASYDSAWRIGAALERAGKRSQIKALPAIGDTVEIAAGSVPTGLMSLPSFAALATAGTHKIKNLAEVGALIALGQNGPLHADIVIADTATEAAIASPLNALRDEIQSAGAEAVTAFSGLRDTALAPAMTSLAAKEVRLMTVFGRPTIVVAADGGATAAGMFGKFWQRLALSSSLIVQSADLPAADGNTVTLKSLGGLPGSFDVLAHADWNTAFDIGTVSADGRIPGTLVLDVAAAPSAARTAPVVSVFMNEILLGAKQLEANGRRERITAHIPRSVLTGHNVLRVAFVRQLASDRCRETPEPYPVSVLPSSHLLLVDGTPADNFSGLVSRFASGGNVIVPDAYLANAQETLPRVIRMAMTANVSPITAKFLVADKSDAAIPKGPFLLMDVAGKGVDSQVKLDKGRLILSGKRDRVLLDVAGLNGIGVIEVVKAGANSGVMYRTVGSKPPAMDQPIVLSDGNFAAIGDNGLLAEMNTIDPSGRHALIDEEPSMVTANFWWLIPVGLIVAFIILLLFASRMRRRKNAKRTIG